MYRIGGWKLRTVRELVSKEENKKLLSNSRLIIFQHLLEDTKEFIDHILESGAEIDCVFGKEYSIDESVRSYLEERGLKVVNLKYSELEKSSVLTDVLIRSLRIAKLNNQKVIIHEVGGYFNKAIQNIPTDLQPFFAGVVEDTTFGYNKYKQIENELLCPVYHVARSPLKEIEAYFVGEAIVLAFNNLMRSFGVSLPGREALVIGYGMIGRNISKSLELNNIYTTVYDTDRLKMLDAYINGHKILSSLDEEELSKYDLIISATGQKAVDFETLSRLKQGVILVSGGSKDTEFDMKTLKSKAQSVEVINSEVKVYKIFCESEVKEIIVLRDGTALNFREKSVPSEVIDLVYSEIVVCILTLLKQQRDPGLHELSHAKWSTIAENWLFNLLGHQTVHITKGNKREELMRSVQ
ncbi:hypothetical protein D3P07_05355 [Paenibacillus sp. 1011MAR3C5]|uniref:hypothetical protein n=1 Tax=Paenibacillus sp. 1011MAR3C5 TaxID=1675787 RepID=UPI000E6C564D|nr:hypothetical protein [Paenibacillus sp. 1011MAR3C5]RJE89666.1 hypothetical protein D3P07_05355 [Paenibacillus sp. 1011MAR3C5]